MKITKHSTVVSLLLFMSCYMNLVGQRTTKERNVYSVASNTTTPVVLWKASLDTTEVVTCIRTIDGGCAFVGQIEAGYMSLVRKYDSLGIKQWDAELNKEKSTFVTAVSEQPNGDLYLSGFQGITKLRPSYVNVGYSSLINRKGEVAWQRKVPEDGSDVYLDSYVDPYIRTSSNDFVVLAGGNVPKSTTNQMRLVFRRTTDQSVVQIDKSIDTISNVDLLRVVSLKETRDGGFIAFVQPTYSLRPIEWQLWKLNKDGGVEWKKTWQEDLAGYLGGDAIVTRNGDFVVVDNTKGYSTGVGYAHFRRFSPSGELLHHTMISSKKLTILNSVAETKNGEFVVGGTTLEYDSTYLSIPSEARDYFLAQLSAEGVPQWTSVWGKENLREDIKSVVLLDDGALLIAGGESEYGAFIANIRPTTSSVAEEGTQQDIASMVITESQEGAYRAEYTLSQPTTVTLKVYSSMGNEVASIIAGSKQDMGVHTCLLPTDNLSSGMYYVRLSIGNQILAKPIVIIR